uniref:SCP domain-containing protein n=1 Tax=Clytia hemisphaerica TaxID=252671 RepID=A0A7M5VFC9_9CNID
MSSHLRPDADTSNNILPQKINPTFADNEKPVNLTAQQFIGGDMSELYKRPIITSRYDTTSMNNENKPSLVTNTQTPIKNVSAVTEPIEPAALVNNNTTSNLETSLKNQSDSTPPQYLIGGDMSELFRPTKLLNFTSANLNNNFQGSKNSSIQSVSPEPIKTSQKTGSILNNGITPSNGVVNNNQIPNNSTESTSNSKPQSQIRPSNQNSQSNNTNLSLPLLSDISRQATNPENSTLTRNNQVAQGPEPPQINLVPELNAVAPKIVTMVTHKQLIANKRSHIKKHHHHHHSNKRNRIANVKTGTKHSNTRSTHHHHHHKKQNKIEKKQTNKSSLITKESIRPAVAMANKTKQTNLVSRGFKFTINPKKILNAKHAKPHVLPPITAKQNENEMKKLLTSIVNNLNFHAKKSQTKRKELGQQVKRFITVSKSVLKTHVEGAYMTPMRLPSKSVVRSLEKLGQQIKNNSQPIGMYLSSFINEISRVSRAGSINQSGQKQIDKILKSIERSKIPGLASDAVKIDDGDSLTKLSSSDAEDIGLSDSLEVKGDIEDALNDSPVKNEGDIAKKVMIEPTVGVSTTLKTGKKSLLYTVHNDDLMLENKLNEEASHLADLEIASNQVLDENELSNVIKREGKFNFEKKDATGLLLRAANQRDVFSTDDSKNEDITGEITSTPGDLMIETAASPNNMKKFAKDLVEDDTVESGRRGDRGSVLVYVTKKKNVTDVGAANDEDDEEQSILGNENVDHQRHHSHQKEESDDLDDNSAEVRVTMKQPDESENDRSQSHQEKGNDRSQSHHEKGNDRDELFAYSKKKDDSSTVVVDFSDKSNVGDDDYVDVESPGAISKSKNIDKERNPQGEGDSGDDMRDHEDPENEHIKIPTSMKELRKSNEGSDEMSKGEERKPQGEGDSGDDMRDHKNPESENIKVPTSMKMKKYEDSEKNSDTKHRKPQGEGDSGDDMRDHENPENENIKVPTSMKMKKYDDSEKNSETKHGKPQGEGDSGDDMRDHENPENENIKVPTSMKMKKYDDSEKNSETKHGKPQGEGDSGDDMRDHDNPENENIKVPTSMKYKETNKNLKAESDAGESQEKEEESPGAGDAKEPLSEFKEKEEHHKKFNDKESLDDEYSIMKTESNWHHHPKGKEHSDVEAKDFDDNEEQFHSSTKHGSEGMSPGSSAKHFHHKGESSLMDEGEANMGEGKEESMLSAFENKIEAHYSENEHHTSKDSGKSHAEDDGKKLKPTSKQNKLLKHYADDFENEKEDLKDQNSSDKEKFEKSKNQRLKGKERFAPTDENSSNTEEKEEKESSSGYENETPSYSSLDGREKRKPSKARLSNVGENKENDTKLHEASDEKEREQSSSGSGKKPLSKTQQYRKVSFSTSPKNKKQQQKSEAKHKETEDTKKNNDNLNGSSKNSQSKQSFKTEDNSPSKPPDIKKIKNLEEDEEDLPFYKESSSSSGSSSDSTQHLMEPGKFQDGDANEKHHILKYKTQKNIGPQEGFSRQKVITRQGLSDLTQEMAPGQFQSGDIDERFGEHVDGKSESDKGGSDVAAETGNMHLSSQDSPVESDDKNSKSNFNENGDKSKDSKEEDTNYDYGESVDSKAEGGKNGSKMNADKGIFVEDKNLNGPSKDQVNELKSGKKGDKDNQVSIEEMKKKLTLLAKESKTKDGKPLLPNQFVNEIVNRVSEQAHKLGLDKGLMASEDSAGGQSNRDSKTQQQAEAPNVESGESKPTGDDSPGKDNSNKMQSPEPSNDESGVVEISSPEPPKESKSNKIDVSGSPGPSKESNSNQAESAEPQKIGNSKQQSSPEPLKAGISKEQASPEPTKADKAKEEKLPAPLNTGNSKEQTSPEPTRADKAKGEQTVAPLKTGSSKVQAAPEPTRAENSKEAQSLAPLKTGNSKQQAAPEPTRAGNSKGEQSLAPLKTGNSKQQAAPEPTRAENSKVAQSPEPQNGKGEHSAVEEPKNEHGGNMGGGGGGKGGKEENEHDCHIGNNDINVIHGLHGLCAEVHIIADSMMLSHNLYRSIHLSQEIALSGSLSISAQEYAVEIVEKHNGVLIASDEDSRKGIGESLYMDCDPHGHLRTGSEASWKWYSQICERGYNFDEEPKDNTYTRDFTQLIWHASTELGVGMATTVRNHMTCTIIVARYKVEGNEAGKYKENVKEGHFDGSVCEQHEEMLDHYASNHHVEGGEGGRYINGGSHGNMEGYRFATAGHAHNFFHGDGLHGNAHAPPSHELKAANLDMSHHAASSNAGCQGNGRDKVQCQQNVVEVQQLGNVVGATRNLLKSTKQVNTSSENVQSVGQSQDEVGKMIQNVFGRKTNNSALLMIQSPAEALTGFARGFHNPVKPSTDDTHQPSIMNKQRILAYTSAKTKSKGYARRSNQTVNVTSPKNNESKAHTEEKMESLGGEFHDTNLPDGAYSLGLPTDPKSKTEKEMAHHGALLVSALEKQGVDTMEGAEIKEMENQANGKDPASVSFTKEPDTKPLANTAVSPSGSSPQPVPNLDKLLKFESADTPSMGKEDGDYKDSSSASWDGLELTQHGDALTQNDGGLKDDLKQKFQKGGKMNQNNNNGASAPKTDKKPDFKDAGKSGKQDKSGKEDSGQSVEVAHKPSETLNNDEEGKDNTQDVQVDKNEGDKSKEEEKNQKEKSEDKESKLTGSSDSDKGDDKTSNKVSLDKEPPLLNEAPKPSKADDGEPKPSKAENSEPKPSNAEDGEPKPSKAENSEPKPSKAEDDEPKPSKAEDGEPKPSKAEDNEPKPSKAEDGEPKPSKDDKEAPDSSKADNNDELSPQEAKHVSGVSLEDRLPSKVQKLVESGALANLAPVNQPMTEQEKFNPKLNTQSQPQPLNNGQQPPPSVVSGQPLPSAGSVVSGQPLPPAGGSQQTVKIKEGTDKSGNNFVHYSDQKDAAGNEIQAEHHGPEAISPAEQNKLLPPETIGPIQTGAQATPEMVGCEPQAVSTVDQPGMVPCLDTARPPVPDQARIQDNSGLGLESSFRFASFGSPVILHIGSTGFTEDPAAFLRIGLTIHNELRKVHKVPPLTIDPMLTAMAFQHAQQISSMGYLKHPSSKEMLGTGENLLLGCYDGEYEISAEEAVLRWYAEVCNPGYSFNDKKLSSGTSHFSQVVWKSTAKLGMAKAVRMQNGLRCTYVVARYAPGGNEGAKFEDNVQPGDFVDSIQCKKVLGRLVTFESRNKDKVKMVEKQKQLARLEFLKDLR